MHAKYNHLFYNICMQNKCYTVKTFHMLVSIHLKIKYNLYLLAIHILLKLFT